MSAFMFPQGAFGWGWITTVVACLALVLTKSWHGRLTLDESQGVQKFHDTPTPRVGGIGIALGLLVAWTQATPEVAEVLGTMLVAALPCFAFGLAEDITKRVSVRARLLATMASGIVAWWLTGMTLSRVGLWGVDYLLQWLPFSLVFTAFAVGGIANAVNIIDGFNGLAAGVLVICLAALAYIAWLSGDVPLMQACLVVGFVALGFIVVNFPSGAIFLGDGGAYGLGFMLAWLAVLLPARNPEVSPWASLMVCAYPVLEVLFSVGRRVITAAPPGAPDRMHLHSLVYALIARAARIRTGSMRNAAVSPFIWVFAAGPAVLATVAYTQTGFLAGAFVLAFGLYAATYAWVAMRAHGAGALQAQTSPVAGLGLENSLKP